MFPFYSPSFQIYRRKKSCQLRTHAVYMLPGLAWAVPNGKTNGAEMCNADKATTQCHMVHGAVCVQLSFFKQQTNPSIKYLHIHCRLLGAAREVFTVISTHYNSNNGTGSRHTSKIEFLCIHQYTRKVVGGREGRPAHFFFWLKKTAIVHNVQVRIAKPEHEHGDKCVASTKPKLEDTLTIATLTFSHFESDDSFSFNLKCNKSISNAFKILS